MLFFEIIIIATKSHYDPEIVAYWILKTRVFLVYIYIDATVSLWCEIESFWKSKSIFLPVVL